MLGGILPLNDLPCSLSGRRYTPGQGGYPGLVLTGNHPGARQINPPLRGARRHQFCFTGSAAAERHTG